MTPIRIIHLINSLFSGILGTCGCLCLIWLILTKTRSEMKAYGRVLLQATILDLINAFSTIFVDPIFTVHDGRCYMLAGEFFRYTPIPVRYGVTIFWGFMTIVLSNFLSVLFYCRYIVLCHKAKITKKLYVKLMLLPIGSAVVYVILSIVLFYPTDEENEKASNDLSGLLNDPGDNAVGFGVRLSIVKGDDDLILLVYCLSMFIINYIVVLCLTYKIWHYMRSVAKFVVSKTKEMQLQLSKTLFCQAATPFVTLFVPVMFLLVPTLLKMDVTVSTVIVSMGMPWVPCLNSVLTMWIIKPYRNAVRNAFWRAKIRIYTSDNSKSNFVPKH